MLAMPVNSGYLCGLPCPLLGGPVSTCIVVCFCFLCCPCSGGTASSGSWGVCLGSFNWKYGFTTVVWNYVSPFRRSIVHVSLLVVSRLYGPSHFPVCPPLPSLYFLCEGAF